MCDNYTLDYLKDLAIKAGVYKKGQTQDELCELVRKDIPPRLPVKAECAIKPLGRLKYQASELGINPKLYSEANKQYLCNEINQKLRDRDEKDEYLNVPNLPNAEFCYASSRIDAIRAKLEERGIAKKPKTNPELRQVASLLGLDVGKDTDRSTLCYVIRREIAGLERGNEFRQIRQKGAARNTYANYTIPDEEKLSIPQLSRSLPSNPKRKIVLSEQQILPAVYLADPSHTGLILQHGVGTGKTFAAINTSQVLLRRGMVKKVVVITPTSLQENFIQQFRDYNQDLSTDPRYDFYTPQLFLNRIRANAIPVEEDTLLIVDEAHNYRTSIWGSTAKGDEEKIDPQSASYYDVSSRFTGTKTRAVFRFLQNPLVKKVLLLTATPFVNSYYDIENLLAMVEKRRPKLQEFTNESMQDVRSLYEGRCLVHVYDTPAEEMGRFPRVEKRTQLYEMSPDYYQKYYEIQVNKLAEDYGMYKASKSLSAYFNGVRRAANALDKDRNKASEKLSSLMSLLRRDVMESPSIKILVYSSWIEAGLASITSFLTSNGIKTAAVMGSFSKGQRQEAVRQFNEGEINVLLISRAGGEGLDLKGTNVVYIVDPTWNESAVQQIIGRAVRRGSHDHLPVEERVVRIYSLMLLKPFEAEIKRRRAELPELFKKTFESPDMIGTYDTDLFTAPINARRKVTIKDKETGQTTEMLDDIMSIDLYLYKFMKKKQTVLDKFIEQTREQSSQCFLSTMKSIKRELRNYIPAEAVKGQVANPLSAQLDRIREKLPNVVVYDQPMAERLLYKQEYPIVEAKDIPDEIKTLTSPEIQSLAPDRKLRYVLQQSAVEGVLRFTFFYRNAEGKVVREDVMI